MGSPSVGLGAGAGRLTRGPGMPQSLVLDELHMLAEEVFPKVRQG